MTYLLTLAGQQQTARSLNYAKALAPQMFQRAGTQHFFHSIQITDADGELVATYGREGWKDSPAAIDAIVNALDEFFTEDDPRDESFHVPRSHRLTRYEQLQELADRGIDTWENIEEKNDENP